MVLPLAPEFLQQILCAHQVIVEDLAGDIEERTAGDMGNKLVQRHG